MKTFFADAWYYIALLDRRDANHRDAERLSRQISSQAVITHDAVLTEVLAYFCDAGERPRQIAVESIRDILRTHETIPGDRGLFLAALDRYAARPDKEYSLVDCMSMVVMEQYGIRHVLTNDHHFTQAGFLVVNQ